MVGIKVSETFSERYAPGGKYGGLASKIESGIPQNQVS
jgi:hypothetical protein